MKSGYIYALQNSTYGAHVIKIGLTTREPDVRAKEIYTGSTGVPLQFDIAVAYSVGDCSVAERTIHNRLKAYRINNRREFFRVSPSVAAAIILETCTNINKKLGLSSPEKYPIRSITEESRLNQDSVCEAEDVDIYPIEWRKLSSLRVNLIGTSKLSNEQEDRIKIIKMMLDKIYPQSNKDWTEGFTRDQNPEREIRIWECIAKSLMAVEEVSFASDKVKNEAFSLLLMRSGSPTADVLKRINLEHFTRKSAKQLLDSYELKPKPITVRR